MTGAHLVSTFREQAEACARIGSPMYAQLLTRMADDIESGGPVRTLLRGHEDDRGPSALALRLAGGLHRLVLSGDVPALARYYPTVGGTWDLDGAWPFVRDALAEHESALRAALLRAPQTNEIGRSAALLGGLLHIADRAGLPVRLWEIGSSAGLNLRADHFRYTYPRGAWGSAQSPVVLDDAWAGRTPPTTAALSVVERFGSDVDPIDPTTDAGRLTVSSYVWPDQAQRWQRLGAALDVAAAVPAEVERRGAVEAVEGIQLRDDHMTVLWHSVMWQYLSDADHARIASRIEDLGHRASADAPFAHLFMEPTRRTPDRPHEFLVVLRTWPAGAGAPGAQEVLGVAAPHGIPTSWE